FFLAGVTICGRWILRSARIFPRGHLRPVTIGTRNWPNASRRRKAAANCSTLSIPIHARQAVTEDALDLKPAVRFQAEESQHPEIPMFAKGRDAAALREHVMPEPPAILDR